MAEKLETVRLTPEAMDWARKAQPWSEYSTLREFISSLITEGSKDVLRKVAPQLVPDDKPKRAK